MMRILTIPLLALAVAGCGALGFKRPGGELTELKPISNRFEAKTLWKTSLKGMNREQRLSLLPVVSDGRVYIADPSGRVQALNAGNGQSLWSTETRLPLSGGPGVGDGLVVAGSSEGELVALDAASGSERWRAQVKSEVLSIPAAASGVVVVHTSDDKIYGFGARDGALLWGYSKPIPSLTLQGSSSPVIEGRQVLCGLASGKLTALDLMDGRLLWEASVAIPGGRSELDRMVDIDGTPLLLSGIAFVATFQGNLAAVDSVSGGVFWRRAFSTTSGLNTDRRRLYASDAQDRVHAINPRDGASAWTQGELAGRRITGPALAGDQLVVGDAGGYLHWLAAEDGRLLARSRLGSSGIAATPVVKDGVVYVLDESGDLFAVSPGV